MYRYILTALTAGAILLAFAALPPILSSSALAQKKDPTTNTLNLNSSRSNTYRNGQTTQPGGTKADKTTTFDDSKNINLRMGGGGGGRGSGARMGGGGGTSTK